MRAPIKEGVNTPETGEENNGLTAHGRQFVETKTKSQEHIKIYEFSGVKRYKNQYFVDDV